MKQLMLIVLTTLAFCSIGLGQTLTVKQQKAFNAKANWVEVSRSTGDDEPMYVDSTSVVRVDEIVLYRMKWVGKMAGKVYVTVGGNCLTAKFIFTNIFYEMPNGSLRKSEGNSNMDEAESGTMIYHSLVYACNLKSKEVVVPLTSY